MGNRIDECVLRRLVVPIAEMRLQFGNDFLAETGLSHCSRRVAELFIQTTWLCDHHAT